MPIQGLAHFCSPGRIVAWIVVSLGISAGVSLADPAVNTYTTGHQSLAAVAADGQGQFIVVWTSQDQDGDGTGIFGRRFGADGQAMGDEFPINDYTTGNQTQPNVAADAAGNFIVVWQGEGGPGPGDVFGRRFDADGVPVDPQFQINADTSLMQRQPAVALADDGTFMTTWTNQDRLVARHFDDSGAPTSGDFEIAFDDVPGPYGFRSFHGPEVEALPNGNFVVVWQDHFYAGYGYYYADLALGAVLSDQVSIVENFNASSGSPAEQQRAPSLAPTADGGFMVVWGGYTYYAVYSEILGRRFSADADPEGPIFNPTPPGNTFVKPEDVTPVNADQFLVVWDFPEIEGLYMSSEGVPLTQPFTINTDLAGFDRDPVVAGSGGQALVVWNQDDGGPAMNEMAFATLRLGFTDGFESGDAAGWSTVNPGL